MIFFHFSQIRMMTTQYMLTSDTQDTLGDLAAPSEEDVPSQPVLAKVYLTSQTNNRYRLTTKSIEATHYGLMPAVEYLEFDWEFYAGEEYTVAQLRLELQLEEIKRMVPKRLFLERELEGLLEFGIRYEKEEDE